MQYLKSERPVDGVLRKVLLGVTAWMLIYWFIHGYVQFNHLKETWINYKNSMEQTIEVIGSDQRELILLIEEIHGDLFIYLMFLVFHGALFLRSDRKSILDSGVLYGSHLSALAYPTTGIIASYNKSITMLVPAFVFWAGLYGLLAIMMVQNGWWLMRNGVRK